LKHQLEPRDAETRIVAGDYLRLKSGNSQDVNFPGLHGVKRGVILGRAL
jgi:hypothetical protein